MNIIRNIKHICTFAAAAMTVSACTNLDQTPISTVSPEQYFTSEDMLASYVNGLYEGEFDVHGNWSYGVFGNDNNSDNMCNKSANSHFLPGEWQVDQTGGEWDFTYIYKCNYFLRYAGSKLENGNITGSTENINHYFGEVYFLRAHEYFKKVKALGDMPILTDIMDEYYKDSATLTEASKRSPRDQVVRFILNDLDTAIDLLKTNPDKSKNRISLYAAHMLRSRVALYEASWFKYFKDTAFVPGGSGWPGESSSYNQGYALADYDRFVDSLYTISMESAKIIGDNFPLTPNTGFLQQSTTDAANEYHDMFASTDLSSNTEVVMWKAYSRGLSIVHNVPIAAQYGSYVNGLTRGYVDNFLMANGLPIYDSGSGYAGDDYISDVRTNRDGRLVLFMKEPGQTNILYNIEGIDRGQLTEPYPDITSSNGEQGYSTGYTPRKGGTFDGTQLTNNGGCYTGCIIFRSAEALLNYMEACYEKNGSLDATAQTYWKDIRNRAYVDDNYDATIAATIMSEEAKNDWGAYSAGSVLTDATLYNIRRERRSELLAEGLRMADLRRWRSLDQLIATPYHLEGFKLWGPMQYEYSDLTYGTSDSNVSSPLVSNYIRPQEINPLSSAYQQGGCSWAMAHYLYPIAIEHIRLTGGVGTSPVYQNPYWPTTAGGGAQQ